MATGYIPRLIHGLLLLCVAAAAPATVVRMEFQIGTADPQSVYYELFDADAPVTVANFLNYVEDSTGTRRYDGSIIHRAIAMGQFLFQGGGYTYDPTLGDFGPVSVLHITEDPPIANEFMRPNGAGTLAMATLSGDPDSATSEWFFNYSDNSASLDSGRYTVFGQLLGDYPDVLVSILLLETTNLGGAFGDLPLADTYVPLNPITVDDLVYLNTVEVNPPAHISTQPRRLNFGLVDPVAPPPTDTLAVQNIGGTDGLTLGQIAQSDTLGAPFSIVTDNCSGVTLASLESCTIVVEFASTTPGVYEDTIDIPSSDATQPVVSYEFRGFTQAPVPTLYTAPAAGLDFGDIGVGGETEATVTVRNIGEGTLSASAGAISGTDAASFEVVSDECLVTPLELNGICHITLRMSGQLAGTRTAQLTVNGSPGSQSTQVDLTGLVRASQAELRLPDTLPYVIGDVKAGSSTTATVPLVNAGVDPLLITGITVEGVNMTEFSVTGRCQSIVSGDTCDETVTFTPATTGTRNATLRIESNAPDSPALLPITGTASIDNDGISDAIEDAGPNGGDANNDGVPDSMQEHVATLPDLYGNYVTLEAPMGASLTGVTAVDNPTPLTPPLVYGDPDNPVTFPVGFLGFAVENVVPGSIVDVTLHLPAGSQVNSYFKYGRLNGSTVPSWYLFDFRNDTGAELLPDRVVLHLKDGGRGDDDGVEDGRIVDPGGPGFVSSGGSSGGGCALVAGGSEPGRYRLEGWLVLGLLLALRRSGTRRRAVPGNH